MMKKFFWAALCWATIGVGLAAPLAADIGLSLAYVDMGGQAYTRFKGFVDQAVADSGRTFVRRVDMAASC